MEAIQVQAFDYASGCYRKGGGKEREEIYNA